MAVWPFGRNYEPFYKPFYKYYNINISNKFELLYILLLMVVSIRGLFEVKKGVYL